MCKRESESLRDREGKIERGRERGRERKASK